VIVYVFTFVLNRPPTDDELDAFFAAGNDDVIFGAENGLPIAEFDREASSLTEAIVSAVRSVESVGLVPVRVIDQDLLTLADIADRIGQSRESVRRYATGERGPGGFPPPVNPVRDGTVFYRWSEVVPWIQEHLDVDVSDGELALVVANLVLQARQHRSRVDNIAVLSQLLTT
jgi:hypothetical protein